MASARQRDDRLPHVQADHLAVPIVKRWPHHDAAHEERGQHDQAVEDVGAGVLQLQRAEDAAHADERRRELHQVDETVDAVAKVAAQVLEMETEDVSQMKDGSLLH